MSTSRQWRWNESGTPGPHLGPLGGRKFEIVQNKKRSRFLDFLRTANLMLSVTHYQLHQLI